MLFSRERWPSFSKEEIVKRSRLLVIDDSDFYYLDLFERDGYIIEKWDDVRESTKLEQGYFDIILLDIQGVGKKYSAEQGLGVLKHIKKSNPSQLVIAYSNADWSLKYREFFDLADASLSKTEDYVRFKEEVDRLLELRFSFDYYYNKAVAASNSIASANPKLEKLIRRSIESGKIDKLKHFFEKANDYAKVASFIVQIVSAGIAIKNSLPTP